MRMMYYCKKCHNIVFSDEDYSRKKCFQCEEHYFEASMISEQEAEEMAAHEYAAKFWGLSAKRILLTVQNNLDEAICFNEKTNEIVSESGKTISKYANDKLNWKHIMSDSLKLGKCGELYAQHLLETMGYKVYHPFVDDHGIDLVATKNNGHKILVQVKTVKEGNYSFVQRDVFL